MLHPTKDIQVPKILILRSVHLRKVFKQIPLPESNFRKILSTRRTDTQVQNYKRACSHFGQEIKQVRRVEKCISQNIETVNKNMLNHTNWRILLSEF